MSQTFSSLSSIRSTPTNSNCPAHCDEYRSPCEFSPAAAAAASRGAAAAHVNSTTLSMARCSAAGSRPCTRACGSVADASPTSRWRAAGAPWARGGAGGRWRRQRRRAVSAGSARRRAALKGGETRKVSRKSRKRLARRKREQRAEPPPARERRQPEAQRERRRLLGHRPLIRAAAASAPPLGARRRARNRGRRRCCGADAALVDGGVGEDGEPLGRVALVLVRREEGEALGVQVDAQRSAAGGKRR